MKIDKLSIKNKSELFEKGDPMHDCSFTASFENNILTLVFDNLEQYYGPEPTTQWFGDYKKLTVKYSTKSLHLTLKYGKKEKYFWKTVEELKKSELIMFKYSVDTFNEMTLEFHIFTKKKLWLGLISISPSEIEYIWE